jgi:FkbM family methyltransferase
LRRESRGAIRLSLDGWFDRSFVMNPLDSVNFLRWLGSLSNSIPHFPGRWRIMDWIFHRWFKHSRIQIDVPLNSSVTVVCNLGDEVQFGLWWGRESYEIGPTKFFKSLLFPGAVFVDIGAHVGYYSLVAAPRIGSSGRIYSFEPMSQQFERLTENIRRNQLFQITPLKLALSHQALAAVLHLNDAHNTGSASLRPASGGPVVHQETVECTTLDLFAESEGLSRLDVVKIDVEGLEVAVLRGASRTLARFRPVILIEVVDRLQTEGGSTREELHACLGQLGYQPYRIKTDGRAQLIRRPEDGTLIVFRHP